MSAGPVICRLTGPEFRCRDVRQRDAAVRRLRANRSGGAPGFDELLLAFKNSPMTGMTTVLDLARRKSGYNPIARGDSGQTFFKFLYEIALSQLFTTANESAQFSLKPGDDPGRLVYDFIGHDPDLTPVVSEQISALLGDAHAAKGRGVSRHLLTHIALSADGRCRYVITACSLSAAVMMLPNYTPLIQADGSRTDAIFEFKLSDWPARAEGVLREHLCTIDDWLDAYGGTH